MTTTKTTTTAFEIGNDLVIGANYDTFFVKTSDHIHEYTSSEMSEIYGVTEAQLLNMKQVLNK